MYDIDIWDSYSCIIVKKIFIFFDKKYEEYIV